MPLRRGDGLVMADHFADDEVEELFREIGIELRVVGKAAQPGDLRLLTRRVGRRQAVGGLEHAHRLGAAEALGQHVDERGVDVVDRSAIAGRAGS